MDKKNRTGLQSKISHIFSGVPITEKKKPISEHPEPDKKNDVFEEIQESSENKAAAGETSLGRAEIEPQIEFREQEENIIELSLVEESRIESSPGTQPQTEKRQIEPDSLEPAAKSSQEQTLDEELLEEQFTAIQEDKPEEKTSSDRLKTGQPFKPRPLEMNLQASKYLEPEAKVAKPSLEKNIPAQPVKELIIEKPSSLLNQKSGISDKKAAVHKPPVSKGTGIIADKRKVTQVSRKAPSKLTGKHLTAKPDAIQSRQKVMAVIFIVFFIILVLVMAKNFGFFESGSDSSGTANTPASPISGGKNTGKITIDWTTPPVYEVVRDPMIIGPTIPGIKEGDFIVNGISRVNGESLVLIGTVNYKLGDKIQGYDAEIINISENKVEFKSSDGITWTQAVGEKKIN
ncbi:MAG: hypothetical protein JW787_18570 [Sedimentisphaerales bacterium]|nr:hypothetical protein [Sedimentisphaerales bacterium]